MNPRLFANVEGLGISFVILCSDGIVPVQAKIIVGPVSRIEMPREKRVIDAALALGPKGTLVQLNVG